MGTTAVDERRKSDRLEAASAGLSVRNAPDHRELGIVGNLSEDGMMLIVNRELMTDGILQLSIESLPPQLGCDAIALGVLVLWSAPAATPDQHWAGVSIIDIGDDARRDYDALIAYLAGQDG
jgi:hypothetical protein